MHLRTTASSLALSCRPSFAAFGTCGLRTLEAQPEQRIPAAASMASAAAPAAAATARCSPARRATAAAGIAMPESAAAPYMAIHLRSIQSLTAHSQSACKRASTGDLRGDRSSCLGREFPEFANVLRLSATIPTNADRFWRDHDEGAIGSDWHLACTTVGPGRQWMPLTSKHSHPLLAMACLLPVDMRLSQVLCGWYGRRGWSVNSLR